MMLQQSADRFLKLIAAGLFSVAIALCAAVMSPDAAQAATAWEKVVVPEGGVAKVGDYYFMEDEENYELMWSKDGDPEHYAYSPMSSWGTFVQGTKAFYTSGGVLYSYDFVAGDGYKVKSLGKDSSGIGAVYGDNVYINYSSFDKWKYWTRVYNTKTKKLSSSLGNFMLTDSYGKYAASCDNYRTDVGGVQTTLYKLTSNGVKKVKQLAKHGQAVSFVAGKLYYTKGSDSALRQAALYRCNLDGSSAKKLGSWKAAKYSQVVVYNITSTTCDVHKDFKTNYRYTYKTKKLKAISE